MTQQRHSGQRSRGTALGSTLGSVHTQLPVQQAGREWAGVLRGGREPWLYGLWPGLVRPSWPPPPAPPASMSALDVPVELPQHTPPPCGCRSCAPECSGGTHHSPPCCHRALPCVLLFFSSHSRLLPPRPRACGAVRPPRWSSRGSPPAGWVPGISEDSGARHPVAVDCAPGGTGAESSSSAGC